MDDYKYEFCGGCEWRESGLMCDACDEGDQFEEAQIADDEEPFLNRFRKFVPIKEAA
jgi:hypothetical protein